MILPRGLPLWKSCLIHGSAIEVEVEYSLDYTRGRAVGDMGQINL